MEIRKTLFQFHPIRDLIDVRHGHIPYFPLHVIIGEIIVDLPIVSLRVTLSFQGIRFIPIHVEHITGHHGSSPDLGRVIVIGIATGHVNTSPLSQISTQSAIHGETICIHFTPTVTR